MPVNRRHLIPALLVLFFWTSACENVEEHDSPSILEVDAPVIEPVTSADSVAVQVVTALGGVDTWLRIPYVRFDFAVESPGRSTRRHHLWNKGTGDYRLEYDSGVDSTTIVLFNTNSMEGTAYINGDAVEGDEGDGLIARAHRTFINDTYWMLAPLKVFDDGVQRGLDTTTTEGERVLTLQFDSVGYTPGDRYWLMVDDSTGRVNKWEYVLQGRDTRGQWMWEDYRSIASPAGNMMLAETRSSVTSETRILTDNIEFPESVDAELFTDPSAGSK